MGSTFEQYYLGCLSQASYLVGATASRCAVIVDPRRDVHQYVADAATRGVQITHVLQTHLYADFLSGHLERAEQIGATIVFGAAATGRVGFPAHFAADGERIELGEVTLEVLATPGHTPESICVVVRETADGEPWGC